MNVQKQAFNTRVIVEAGQAELARLVARIRPEMEQEVLRIRADTISGKDIHGGQFQEYAPVTARLRAKNNLRTSPVNLAWTGDMLASISVGGRFSKYKVNARIYFKDKTTSYTYLPLEGKNPVRRSVRVHEKVRQNLELGREFFGMSSQHVDSFINRIVNG